MINIRGVIVLATLALVFTGVRARAADGQMLDVRSFCAAARSIYAEAGRDMKTAERLAAARGHSAYTIAMARRFCR